MQVVWITIAGLLLTGTTTAATIHVDAANPACPGSGAQNDPFCTIQAGIHAALPGDTVLVAPGTYLETINFFGKAIVVESVAGAASTTIDANFAGSCVTFASNEGPQSVLRGFRLIRGGGTLFSNPFGQGIQGGFGIFIKGASPTITENRISGHVPTSPPPIESEGAAIYAEFGSPSILNNTISGNTAQRGGGLYAKACSDLVVKGNYFFDNEGINTGAAFELLDCKDPEFVDNDFERNGAPGAFGTPLSAGSSLVFSTCTGIDFRENEIWESFVKDDAILSAIASTGVVRGNVIRDCRTNTFCGFAIVNCSDFLFVDNDIRDNNGGVIGGGRILSSFASTGGPVVLDGNRFAGNTTLGLAAGLQTSGPHEVIIRRCTFEQHTIPNSTGLALRTTVGPVAVEDCVFRDNGVGLVAGAGTHVRRCTFSNNTASAMLVEAFQFGVVPVESSILYQNGSTEIFISSGLAAVSDSLVSGGYPGTNVISADPMFLNAAIGDFRLLPGSPCIDTGSATDFTCGVDVAGAPRRVSGSLTPIARIDMGANEFSNVTLEATKLTGINTFQLASSGTAGLPTVLFASVATAELCASPAGTLLVDLAAPSSIVPWLPLPSQVQLTIPPAAIAELHVQQLALGPSPGTGNLSALVTLALD